MINITVFAGKIVKDDENDPLIRYVEIYQEFLSEKGDIKKELVPVMNWNKERKGELFTFSINTLLIIKGRLENYKGRFVVICENLTYLGKE
jgi:hypothetical protein